MRLIRIKASGAGRFRWSPFSPPSPNTHRFNKSSAENLGSDVAAARIAELSSIEGIIL